MLPAGCVMLGGSTSQWSAGLCGWHCTVTHPVLSVAAACSCEADYQCNLLVQPGSTCQCVDGVDTCKKYSRCDKTPCKVCSDCLAAAAKFTLAQEFNQDFTVVKAAFTSWCLGAKYTEQACADVLKDQRATLNGIKRAALLCHLLGECSTTPYSGGCALKPTPLINTTDGAVNLCTIEGVDAGRDLAGTSSVEKPTGTCEFATETADCGVGNECTGINRPFSKCAPKAGLDTATMLGLCTKKPAVACKDCLDQVAAWVTSANTNRQAYTAEELKAAFTTACTSASIPASACDRAAQGIATSFRGNKAFRAGAICEMLGECVATSLPATDAITAVLGGMFSRCSVDGLVGGVAVVRSAQEYPSTLAALPAGKCRCVHMGHSRV